MLLRTAAEGGLAGTGGGAFVPAAAAGWMIAFQEFERLHVPEPLQQGVARRTGDHDGPVTEGDPNFVDPASGHRDRR